MGAVQADRDVVQVVRLNGVEVLHLEANDLHTWTSGAAGARVATDPNGTIHRYAPGYTYEMVLRSAVRAPVGILVY